MQTQDETYKQYASNMPMLLSIVHRGTGIVLSIGSLLLAYWLLAIISGPAVYARVLLHIHAWYGLILLIVCIFSLYYHLCNGIRFLFLDAGIGTRTASGPGYAVIVATLLLTVATCAFGMGAA